MTDHHHAEVARQGPVDRRSLLIAATLASCSSYLFLREARAADRITDSRLSASGWIGRQDDLARALRAGTISPTAWHDEVARLAGEVDIAQLMAEAGRAAMPAGTPFMRDPVKRVVGFLDDQGRPRHLAYVAALFSFGPDNVITPHAHEHMASAHMVVDGKVRIRTFDRIEDQAGALVIRPTGDHVGGVGSAAAMTTAKDNVHWFTPVTPQATTFDVIIDGLDPGRKSYVIQPVDPNAGVRRPDGTIVAPLLSIAESMARYPAHV